MKRSGSNRFVELSDQADRSSSTELVGNGSRKKKKKKGQENKKAVSTVISNAINPSSGTAKKYVEHKSVGSSASEGSSRAAKTYARNIATSPTSSERLSDYDIIDKDGDNSETTGNTADRERNVRTAGLNYSIKSTGTITYFVVGKGNLDPYEVRKDLTHVLDREEINITADRGSVKVEYVTLNELENLQRLTSLAGREIRVRKPFEPSETLTQLIIFDVPISLTDEIIKESCDCISVHRIKRSSGEERQPTTSVILTYSKVNAPGEVKIQYLRFRTRTYVREPVRCYNCQIFGHVAKHCFRSARCAKCCGSHDTRKCSSPPMGPSKCASCESVAHTTGHKDCPSRLRATEIAKTVAKEGVTYAQAARGYNNPELKKITKTQEQSTQTQEQKKPTKTRQGERRSEGTGKPREDKCRERITKTFKEDVEENLRRLLKHQVSLARQLSCMITGVWKALTVLRGSDEIDKLLERTEIEEIEGICRELNGRNKKFLATTCIDFSNLPKMIIETRTDKTSEGDQHKKDHEDKIEEVEDVDEKKNEEETEDEDEDMEENNNGEESEDGDMDVNEEEDHEDEEGEDEEEEGHGT